MTTGKKNVLLVAVVAMLLLPTGAAMVSPQSVQAASETWDGGTGGTGTAWFTTDNWVSNTGYAGSQTDTANTDIASFTATGPGNPGIDMNFLGNKLYLGAIDITGGDRAIGNSSTTAGTLVLNGATVNGVANTILSSTSSFLNIEKQRSGLGAMVLELGNATENIVQFSGTSSQGLYIKSNIIGSGKNLTVQATGAGVVKLEGTNSYTGTTTISSGRLSVATAANLCSGNTAVVQTGAGQLYVSSAITLNNPFNISGLGYAETSGARLGAIRLSGTTSTLSNTITLSGDSGTGRVSGTTTVTGKITGSYAMGFTGGNSASNTASTFVLSNTTNDYSGDTKIDNKDISSARTVNSTTLRLGASNVIPNGATAGNLVFNGANADHLTVLDLNGFNETINGLSAVAAAGAKITNSATGASVLEIGDNNNTSSFSGTITDSGVGKTLAITKVGTGTLTLSGTNSYTGPTAVDKGMLLVNGSLAATAGKVTVNADGTLGGTGTMACDVDVFGTLAPGASIESLDTGDVLIAATGTLDNELGRDGATPVSDIVNVTGSVTLAAGANLKLKLDTGLNDPEIDDVFYLVANDDTDVVTGEFTKLDGVNTALGEGSTFTWNSQTWKITYKANADGIEFTNGNDIAIKVIPEPATMGLLALGGLMMLGRRRRS